MQSSIAANRISFQYKNEAFGLRNVSVEVQKGQLCSIIGPNGGGKTTLLRNLARQIGTREKNEILLNGRALNGYGQRELAKNMAVVNQNNSIPFEFSVEDIVLMGRTPYLTRFAPESKHDRKVAGEAMQKTGVTHLRGKTVTQISGGELQRVIIARALAQQTGVILLDEPISQLDMNHQVRIMELLRALCREEGVAVVVVLHDLNIAAQYSDKLMLVKDGEMLAADAPEAVITKGNMRMAYGIEAEIIRNPQTDKPFIIHVSCI